MANASAVAGVYTGSSMSAASAAPPPTPATRSAASSAAMVLIGKRTSTRSSAGTFTRLPAGPSRARFPAWTTTSTDTGTELWLWTTTGSSKWSPKLAKRGADGRIISGRRAVIEAVVEPKWAAPSTATTITR